MRKVIKVALTAREEIKSGLTNAQTAFLNRPTQDRYGVDLAKINERLGNRYSGIIVVGRNHRSAKVLEDKGLGKTFSIQPYDETFFGVYADGFCPIEEARELEEIRSIKALEEKDAKEADEKELVKAARDAEKAAKKKAKADKKAAKKSPVVEKAKKVNKAVAKAIEKVTEEDEAKTEKACSKCLTVKALSEFYRSKQNKDGHTYVCKACKKASKTAKK